MAISLRAAGSWAASNATTQVVTLPTHQTGDMLIVRTIRKPFTSPDATVINTAGWAPVATGVANGSTANGVGVGSMGFKAFYKVAASAAETNPTVTWGTTSAPGAAVGMSYQKGAGETWGTPAGNGGGDATARTAQTSTIATHISVTAGDMVDFFRGQCDDSGALTVPTITQTGVTYAAVSEQPAAALLDGTSNDIAADGGYRLATAGTSSAAAVVTGTSAASEQHGAWMTRLRVAASEDHSGTAVLTGHGEAVSAGQKAASTSAVLTGHGTYVHAAAKAASAAPTLTGHGTAVLVASAPRAGAVTGSGAGAATLVQSTARAATVAGTGAGAVTLTYEVAETHSGSVTATGAGAVTYSAATDRSAAIVGTGAGSATLTAAGTRAGAVAATGAGQAALAQATARASAPQLTGAGAASLSVEAARLAAALLSGAGAIALEQQTERASEATLTGAGAVTIVAGETGEDHDGTATLTGYGTIVLVDATDRTAILLLTGGGLAVLPATSTRTGLALLTGHGVVTISGAMPVTSISGHGISGALVSDDDIDILLAPVELNAELQRVTPEAIIERATPGGSA